MGNRSHDGESLDGEAKRLLLNANDLRKMKFPDPEWVVPGLIPVGVTLLAGPPKIGKSFFALNVVLACALSRGQNSPLLTMLGQPGMSCEALLLALEDDVARIKNRVVAMLGTTDLPDLSRAYIKFKAPSITDGLIWKLRGILDQHPEIKLLVVDPLGYVVGPQNPNEVVGVLIQPFKELCAERNVSTILVHRPQPAKGKSRLEEVHRSRSCNTIITLKRIETERQPGEMKSRRQVEMEITGRDFDECLVKRLEFNGSSCRWLEVVDSASCPSEE
jgi:RecA-family ATPase